MQTLTVKIPQNIIDELQRTGLELEARKGVIDRYFEKHMEDSTAEALDSVPFNHFMSLLAESEAAWNILKEEITKTFVPVFLQEHDVDWEIDYSSCTMTITIKCDCFIPELEKE